MHRTLVELGPLAIRSYGVMLAIAFWVGIELSMRLARKRGLDSTSILDLGIVVLISSVVGSRLLYVVTHLSEYQHDPTGVFKVWEGGLTFYGGLVAAVIFGIAHLRRSGAPVLVATDVVAPQIALGIAIARIGCFLNGCCFGRETDLPWACEFPPDSQAGWVLAGKSLHPTQIYSSIANFVIFLILWRLLHRNLRAGTVFYSFLVIYGVWRLVIDFFRYYEPSMYGNLGGAAVTWNQALSVGLIGIGTALLLRLRRSGEAHHSS
jgi:phosphatidylglycerol:prolipoprotein diacylglycerol transferase